VITYQYINLLNELGPVLKLAIKVEGDIGIEKGSLSNAYSSLGGGNPSRAVIEPGTTISSGGPPTPPPSVIRSLVIGL